MKCDSGYPLKQSGGKINRLLFFIIMFAVSHCLFAEEVLLPEEEAPEAFIDADIDDSDVELFLSGSWKVDISASSGFGLSSDGKFDSGAAYPGMEPGFTFYQNPDFTTYLSILNRFIFEASFTDVFEDSTFRLGYQGQPGEFLQTVSAGNMGISLSDNTEFSDYFYIPGGSPSSFGLYSSFSADKSSHEFLFRFDPDKQQEKLYIGSEALTEVEMDVSAYLRGRFYIIPGSPEDAAVYMETSAASAEASAAGISGSGPFSGRYFIKAETGAYSYSSASGRLYFREKPAGAVLVYSEEFDWDALIDNPYLTGGKKLSDFQAATSGGDMLIISDPGKFSPFESAAAYNLDTVVPDEKWKTRIYLASGSAEVAGGIELDRELLNDKGIFIIRPAAGGTVSYPLSDIIAYPEDVYGPEAIRTEVKNPRRLIIRMRQDADGYTIDDPVAGTVRVYKNGIEITGWKLEGDSIVFDTPPGPEDRLRIVYRKKRSGEIGGDLLIASANTFSIADNWAASFNTGLRWNVDPGSYALPGEESSGSLNAAASVGYDKTEGDTPHKLKAGLDAGFSLTSENSAGRLLLKNMSGSGLQLPLNRNRVFPSSVPDGRAAEDRGLLIYKDYRITTSPFSAYLMDYDQEPAADLVFLPDESTAGNRFKAGPYTAAASKDGRNGEILVVDYSLPENGSWVGAQIPLAPGSENIDLSVYNALSFDCMSETGLSDVKIYVEIGSLSEDLDGDGILDFESSEYSKGFIFNDPNSEAGTLVGGDNLYGNNGIKDSEDFNGNGFLDSEKAGATGATAEFEVTGKFSQVWGKARLYFTETGPAGRDKLKNAEFIRITAVNNGASGAEGRIFFDNFRFEGKSLHHDEGSGLNPPEFSEIPEYMIPDADRPDAALAPPHFPDGQADSSSNEVLQIKWTEPWQLHSVINPVDADAYGSIVFYIHTAGLSQAGLSVPVLLFSLTNSSGAGISAEIPLEITDSWQKIEIKPESGTLFINDQLSGQAVINYDPAAGKLVKLTVGVDEASTGTLYIDEILLKDPVLNLGAGVNAELDYNSVSPLVVLGNFELVGPLNFYQKLSTSFTGTVPASFDLSAGLSTNLSILEVGASMSWNSIEAGGPLQVAHSIRLPVFSEHLSVSDEFRADNTGSGDFSKQNNLNINAGPVSGRLAGFTAGSEDGLLVQKWRSDIDLSLQPFALGTSLALLLSSSPPAAGWTDYFSGWLYGTALAGSFTGTGVTERKTSLRITPALSTRPLGVTGTVSLDTSVEENETFSGSILMKLGFPLSLQFTSGKVTAEAGYIRSAEYEYSVSSGTFTTDSFAADASALFETFSNQAYLFTSIPAFELFSPAVTEVFRSNTAAAGVESGFFDNSLYLSLSRNYSSRILDLVMPYYIDFTAKRSLMKDFSDIEDSNEYSFGVRTAAINLFGTAGIFPFFSFYFSDELGWSVNGLLSSRPGHAVKQEYDINLNFSIFSQNQESFSFSSNLFLPIPEEENPHSLSGVLLYTWNHYPSVPVKLPIFTENEEKLQVFTNEERLYFLFGENVKTELKHTTSLIIPQTFTLAGFVSAGMEINTLADNHFLFGVKLGITGSIFY